MKNIDTTKIKNIVLAGQSGCGKTALAEALLYRAGVIDRIGKSADGNTVCDFDPEEIKRTASINLALTNFEYGDFKINLIDTPGSLDFAAAANEGMFAGDTVIICVSAKSGVHVGTVKAFNAAKKLGKHVLFVVTKIDDPNQDFYATLQSLKDAFGAAVCPVIVPEIVNNQFKSLVHLGRMKSYTYDKKGVSVAADAAGIVLSEKEGITADSLLDSLSEAVAETDDALMEKFFEGEPFTQEEISHGIHEAMRTGRAMPVFTVSCTNPAGCDLLLEFLKYMPDPTNAAPLKATDKDGKELELKVDASAPLSAFVFRTVADPFVGKMSFMKILSGTLTADKELINATTGATERIGKLYTMLGKKQTEVSSAVAGDIVVATKIAANTCDTLCAPERIISYAPISYPNPTYRMAVKATAQGDEAKISNGLQRLLEEDKALSFTLDTTTKEQVLAGLGDQHLDVVKAKLKSKFGVDVLLEEPKIAYRETIRKKTDKVQGRHKKQSGGHGQFGDVWIEFEPTDSDSLVFEEKIFGGAVPKNFFPAIEKGLQESVKKGVLAGCPVVGIKATLLDGSYHPVDSSEMAFKIAASLAFKEGMKQASPILLEPIGALKVTIPDSKTGDVMGDLNKRRGRVLGMEPAGDGMTVIQAEAPVREMHDFTMYLRQVAKGMGEYTFDFLRYEPLPANLLDEVVASVKSGSEDDE
ncbi:MAG: elongation factor G [Oscillospiraceae bacterium]|nr:elongation factor G [Oscillospiraceae bacterium]